MAKKVVGLLKGAAITGVAIGGASALTGADLVFAQEIQEEVNAETELVTEQSIEETYVQEQQDEYDLYSYETVESAEEAVAEAEEEITATEELKAEAEIEKDTIVENLVSAQTEQNTVANELLEAQNQKAAVEQDMVEREQAYHEAGYDQEGLDEQQAVVDEKAEEEAAVRETLSEQGKNLTLDNYYKNEGRQLAKEMILYKLILTGEVSAEDADKVFFGENFNHDYEDKHYCVKYVKIIDDEPVYLERYFDYVTCDEEGNSMFQGLVENENDSSLAAGINVVEKTPTYKVWTEDPHKVSTYEKNVSGKIKNQSVFGYTFHAAQRDEKAGFYAEEGQQKKGVDWYTQKQYQQDANNRNEYKEFVETVTNTLSNLDSKIAELTTTLSNVTNRINTLREDLEDIQVEIQGYDNKVDYLKDKVDALNGRIQDIIAAQQTQNDVEPEIVVTPQIEESLQVVEAPQAVETQQVVEISQASVQRTVSVAASRTIEESQVPATVTQVEEQVAQPAVEASARQVVIQPIQEIQVPLAVVDIEAEDDMPQTVTIQEQEIAKAAEVAKSLVNWNGSTLPLLGTIAGFVGLTKIKRDDSEAK